jgi:FtsP/CotA-like multicopper oxidase with cupredoxin domain
MRLFFVFILCSFFNSAFGKVVKYELIASRESTNLSGKKIVDFAIMINKSIPAPVLEFTEGDDAEIVLKNNLTEDEVSIHWHGLLLDPYMDGVPYVNTPPIRPGESFTFKFKIRQHGTYWYHSHTNVQEQKGVYGAIVIHPKVKTETFDRDIVAVISDWSDENSSNIIKNLRKDGEYYALKKGTLRSWHGAIKANALKSFLYNEFSRMGGMDLSDVGYDAFLINGKMTSSEASIRPGEKVRVRIINAAASTYFYLSLGNEPLEVISADGQNIKPTKANDILIGPAETYDIKFVQPKDKSLELRATPNDGSGKTSLWLGSGEKIAAKDMAKPDLYMSMDSMSGGHEQMDHSKMDMPAMDHSKIVQTLTSQDFAAEGTTAFSGEIPRKDIKLSLDGDMERYVWFINGKAIHEDRTITIDQDEVVRFTFVNNTMMSHPMHLHGHFFRVLNKFGDSSPLKHTVDVPPFSIRTVEFLANEPGDWMLHCHNLYHLKTGMARVVKYSSFTPRKDIVAFQKQDPHNHDPIYHKGTVEVATNHGELELGLMKTRDDLILRGEVREENDDWEGEGDLFYKRWLSRYSSLILGGEYFEKNVHAIGGISYLLPFLVETNILFNSDKHLRLDVGKKFQWTEYIFTNVDLTFRQKERTEYEITLMYQKYWSWAAGLMLTEDKLGIGVEYNF